LTRRKVFDPRSATSAFWRRDVVQVALARRDVAGLFRAYLGEFSECTQTQLALLTEHDRSDVSNWVRGTRHGQVSDINVLTRIAEGLRRPDSARMLMGLAPADALVTSVRDERELTDANSEPADAAVRLRVDGSNRSSPRIAICGSRAAGTNARVIDAAVRSLARLVMVQRLLVNHGPVGIGIEVVTHIADHYQPPGLRGAVAIFGRRNVVLDAEYVVLVGGGNGTQAEVDLALSMGKRIVALGASGGTAAAFQQRMSRDQRLRGWLSEGSVHTLATCSGHKNDTDSADLDRMTDDFVKVIEELLQQEPGDPRD
jgi:hypothetical protein